MYTCCCINVYRVELSHINDYYLLLGVGKMHLHI